MRYLAIHLRPQLFATLLVPVVLAVARSRVVQAQRGLNPIFCRGATNVASGASARQIRQSALRLSEFGVGAAAFFRRWISVPTVSHPTGRRRQPPASCEQRNRHQSSRPNLISLGASSACWRNQSSPLVFSHAAERAAVEGSVHALRHHLIGTTRHSIRSPLLDGRDYRSRGATPFRLRAMRLWRSANAPQ